MQKSSEASPQKSPSPSAASGSAESGSDLCADAAVPSPADGSSKKKKNRCEVCRKKVGLTGEKARLPSLARPLRRAPFGPSRNSSWYCMPSEHCLIHHLCTLQGFPKADSWTIGMSPVGGLSGLMHAVFRAWWQSRTDSSCGGDRVTKLTCNVNICYGICVLRSLFFIAGWNLPHVTAIFVRSI